LRTDAATLLPDALLLIVVLGTSALEFRLRIRTQGRWRDNDIPREGKRRPGRSTAVSKADG
jgi:hypothetical protein